MWPVYYVMIVNLPVSFILTLELSVGCNYLGRLCLKIYSCFMTKSCIYSGRESAIIVKLRLNRHSYLYKLYKLRQFIQVRMTF